VANVFGVESPRLAVVTVLYRSERFVRPLLESVAAVDYPRERLELHLVDNGPGDGTLAAARAEIARLGARLPEVIIHEPGQNLGFAGGNNVALRAALARGVDACFLLNPDAAFEPAALREAVQAMRSEPGVGSVQSLLVLAESPELVNTSGNHLHFLGFGYTGGYQAGRADVADRVVEIAYASGASMLLPRAALEDVGLFDETLWLYHEDLDLGWRLRLAGYRNLLAPRSVCRHHYEFSRSRGKWFWLERNRRLVVLKNYRWPTVLLLLPWLVVTDAGLVALALKGGWWREMLRAVAALGRPSLWSYLLREHGRIARSRRVADAEILRHMTAVIDHADFASPVVKRLLDPLWTATLGALRVIVRW
jgi:GT2 family glycosyltransferase